MVTIQVPRDFASSLVVTDWSKRLITELAKTRTPPIPVRPLSSESSKFASQMSRVSATAGKS